MKYFLYILVVLLLFILIIPQFAYAVEGTETDTTDSPAQFQTPADNNGDGDEDVVVIIFPKRIEPDLPEVELERSFQRELKEGMGEFVKPDDELSQIEKVQSIKKAIEKKRE